MIETYQEFLKSKDFVCRNDEIKIDKDSLNKMLFPFQMDIVRWALLRGRAAVFADCGLGKTPIQLEWASKIVEKTKKPVLIFAPLAVSKQTVREGRKFGIKVSICESKDDIKSGKIFITNYHKIHKFNPNGLGGLVLDESSILKGFDTKYRKELTEFTSNIHYRLACTATPAPNDIAEIINHSEFLGIMKAKEILALFFIQDGNATHKWKLKGHAKNAFWQWLASWSVALRAPSDLGHDDNGFILPPLNIKQITVAGPKIKGKGLFNLPNQSMGLAERRKVRRESTTERVRICEELANNSSEQWLIWCDLNRESEELAKAIPDSVEVRGSDSPDHKEKSLLDFQSGKIRVLVTKPAIAGHGMNFQCCHNMAFVGLSDSYERLYQATRRCWRFGQDFPVNVYHIVSDMEGAVVENIKKKEKEAMELFDNVIAKINLFGQIQLAEREEMTYAENVVKGNGWQLKQGDCIDRMKEIKDNSIGLSIFSPPFPGMYAYTNSRRDLGNSKSIEELINQFKYLIPELLRVTAPGRHCCLHLSQVMAFKNRDGYIGIKDFRGKIIEAMENAGWIYYGEVCIDKDPQVKAIRTKDRGLLFKTLAKDASHLHMALADYLLQFRKPGGNEDPIKAGISEKYKNTDGWITSEEWIEWAAPVWYRQTSHYPGGIRETNVLNARVAKNKDDEKHLCPLQLGVIERAIKLWSNPGDTILSPFAGIGSEGYVALKLERKFIGIELKDSYFRQAIKNLKTVRTGNRKLNLFQGAPEK